MPSEDLLSHLVIIGAGATGCALLPLASTLPFKQITLIDGDTVEAGNLIRQPLYGSRDTGRYKTEVAIERTAHLHDHRKVISVPLFLDQANIQELLEHASIVADCTDDIHVRVLVDSTCGMLRIALVTGSVHGTQLQVMTLHAALGDHTPLTLRSYFPGQPGAAQDGCDMRKVPIAVPAMAAVLMAQRIQALLDGDHRYLSRMDLVDAEHGSWMKIAPPTPPEDPDLIATHG